MDVIEKLQVMLPHWIEHNKSHGQEFSDWAGQIGEGNAKLAEQLTKAVQALENAQQALEEALTLAGGAAKQGDDEKPEHGHGHHHHHHH
jgi:hypothetical protein